MSSHTVCYFHRAALAQRFAEALNEALREGRLQNDEHLWLWHLGTLAPPDTSAPVRVDRLYFNDGSPAPFELSAALMFSHVQGDTPATYLYTLAEGVEVFADRPALLAELRRRFANASADTVFEAEKVEQDPFTAQMLAIVDHYAAHARSLAEQLLLTPSLEQVLTASLGEALGRVLPTRTIDSASHCAQFLRLNADPTDIPATRTLAQVALDDYCQVPMRSGEMRHYLDEEGRPANDSDRASFAQALALAIDNVPRHYEGLLRAWWSEPWDHQRSRRDLLIEVFDNAVRRALYQTNHEGLLSADIADELLSLLERDPERLPSASILHGSSINLRFDGGDPVPLAATFTVQFGSHLDRSVLWFTPDQRWLRFDRPAVLLAHFHTPEGREQLRAAVPLEYQPALGAAEKIEFGLLTVRTPLIADRVDSILALQASNLAYAIGLPDKPPAVAVMIDDAMDVRALIDPAQLQLNGGRWRREAPFDFHEVWRKPGTVSSVPVKTSPRVALTAGTGEEAEQAPIEHASSQMSESEISASVSWLERSQMLDVRVERLQLSVSVLRAYAEQAIQPYVGVLFGAGVNAREVVVGWPDVSADESVPQLLEESGAVDSPRRSGPVDLVSLLIECVTGVRSQSLSLDAQVTSPSAETAPVAVINHVLRALVPGFVEGYLDSFRQSRTRIQRKGDRSYHLTTEAIGLRGEAMSLDYELRRRRRDLDEQSLAMIRAVMTQPVGALRDLAGPSKTEVFSLALGWDEQPARVLAETLVLKDSLDRQRPVVIWTATKGWGQFASIDAVKTLVERELRSVRRDTWLTLLQERDRRSLRGWLSKSNPSALTITLEKVQGDALATLQQHDLRQQMQSLRDLCTRASRCHFRSGLLTRLAQAAEVDEPLFTLLDSLALRLEASVFEAMLPPWISHASLPDLRRYQALLDRYYVASSDGRDFLFDIPSLPEFTRQRLIVRLLRDFPGQTLDPQQITVTSTRYISPLPMPGQLPSAIAADTVVHSESLVAYAIGRFIDHPDSALSITLAPGQSVPALTADYVRWLVRELDVGAAYTAMLRKVFARDDADYAVRRQLYLAQMPLELELYSLPSKVEGKLSAKVCEYIAAVFDMPDGIAREPVDGVSVIISPFQLVADEGMSPDRVSGLYLIGPDDAEAGPVLLYAIYHPGFVFREYASRAELMTDVRHDEALQQLLISRLDPSVRRRYEHDGFVEPHLPFSTGLYDVPTRAPGPVSLGVEPMKGNVLHVLFEEELKLLLDMSVTDAVTNVQVDQAGRGFLMRLGIEQVLALLPGRLGALITLWQSHTLFRASVISASGHRWGRAVSEFSAALGSVIAVREQAAEPQVSEDAGAVETDPVDPVSGVDEPGRSGPLVFSWRGNSLSAELRARLDALEAKGVALDQMRHDRLLNLYLDPKTRQSYAVVAGKVYRVEGKTAHGEWFVVGADGAAGPSLFLDAQQRWQLNLDLRLRGGGCVNSTLNASGVTREAENELIIEAKGMADIRARYREHARQIGNAHRLAQHYLQTSLENLNARDASGELDVRVSAIVGDFFGVVSPDRALLQYTEEAITTLFDALMEPSLSPLSSSRFVIGTNRPGREHTVAFVFKSDPQRRVFLSDRFFNAPAFRLTPQAMAEGFRASRHYRAANLLHELSHLVLNTHDIAYLESMAPPADLLLDNDVVSAAVRSNVLFLHEHRFSHRSQRGDLFTIKEDGQWRDIEPEDHHGYEAILHYTNTSRLEDAREVFLNDAGKRSLVQLDNADSLILLILRLGRRNFAVGTP